MMTPGLDAEGTKALQHYFASCSVIVNSETPGFKHGTGVAVKFNEQNYILTAGHVLREEPRNEKLLIIGRPDSNLKEVNKHDLPGAFFRGTHGHIKSSFGTHVKITQRIIRQDQGDIAALKVDDVTRYLPNTAFHDLSAQGETDISVGRPVVIGGFPGELALHGQVEVAMFTYFGLHNIVPFPEGPAEFDLSNPLDPNVDFLTDFITDRETCDPNGMSGGGSWTIPKINSGEVWIPHRTQLLGIQSGFYREKKLLRLIRIERVKSLLLGD